MRSAELRTLFDGLYGRRAEQGEDRRITFQHRVGSLELEGRWYASLVVERYPGEEVAAGWLLPFLGFKGELHLAIHLVPLATDRTLDFLSRKIRDLRADQIVSSEAASVEANAFTTLGGTFRSPVSPMSKPWLGSSELPLSGAGRLPGPETLRMFASKSSTSSKMAE